MLKKILQNSILTALIRGSSFGVRIVALLIAAHFSGPAEFGTIALFFTIAEIGRLVADFGVDTFTMREYASQRSKAVLGATLQSALLAKLSLGLVSSGIGFVVMSCLRNGETSVVLPFALMIFSPLVMNFPVNYFIARQRGKHIAMFVALSGAASLAVFGAAYMLFSNTAHAFWVIPVAEMGTGLILMTRVPVIRKCLCAIEIDKVVGLLKSSAPIAVATILGIAYGRIDVFFLEKFRSSVELGLYAFAMRLIEPFQFVAGALAVNAYSHITAALRRSDKDGTEVSSKYRKVMALYCVVALATVLLAANFALAVWFPAYSQTQPMLNLAGLILVFKCGNLITTAAIQARGRYTFITGIAIWNFCFLTAAMFMLVPSRGAQGALIAVLMMEGLNFALQNVYLRQIANWRKNGVR